MQEKHIKLSEYAKEKNITYWTAWNHFIFNKIDDAFNDNTGHVYIIRKKTILNNAIVYARLHIDNFKHFLMVFLK
jgi:hypothetical protein